MVRTMRISFLALGLLGSYTTNTQAITLASAQEVLRTVNTYTPIIVLGTIGSVALSAWYTEHKRHESGVAYSAANNALNTARQELIACRTWADQWCIPALKTLNVEPEILNNPATWQVYCSNLSTNRILACARYLSNYQPDSTVLLCKLTAESDHATQAFATYTTAYENWKQASSKVTGTWPCSSQQHDIEFGYSIVMVPVYLRKIEFLKTLIKTRSHDITASAKNQCCTSCCTSACNA